MKDDEKFLVKTSDVCDHSSLLGNMILEAFSGLPDDEFKELLTPATQRGGLIDVRIVFEGREFPLGYVDDRLTRAWERMKQRAARDFVNLKLAELQDRLREAVEPILADFGQCSEFFEEE